MIVDIQFIQSTTECNICGQSEPQPPITLQISNLSRSSQFDMDGLAQDCGNSTALALELPQSCAKPSIWQLTFHFVNSLAQHIMAFVSHRQPQVSHINMANMADVSLGLHTQTIRSPYNQECVTVILPTGKTHTRQPPPWSYLQSHPCLSAF